MPAARRSTTCAKLFDEPYRTAFKNSIEVSLVTAGLGAVFGLLLAYAAIREGTPRFVRAGLTTFSGVAANFAGIPLAAAFIATLGTIGVVTQFMTNQLGVNPYDHGFSVFSKTGIEIVYLYFQIPLMVLVIAPAIDGLRREWREAASSLGAELVAVLAARRDADHDAVDPERVRAPVRQLVLGVRDGVRADRGERRPRAGDDRLLPERQRPRRSASRPGARVRHARRARTDDARLRAAPTPRVEVVAVTPRKRIAPGAVVWLLLGAAYFVIPLAATLIFSLRSNQTGTCCTLENYGEILHDPQFSKTIKTSFILSLETIVVTLLLLVPTVYWVHLRLPRLRPVMGFIALVPFVVPAIILVVGLLDIYKGTPTWFYAEPYGFLVGAYVILAFPYMYFSLDAGFRAIDVHTLTEASQSLGARWTTTLVRVIIPNIKASALAGSFLTLAIVMGEFTIASLAVFDTFPIYIQYINQNKAYPASAVTLLSFAITWAAMLALLAVGRGRRAPAAAGAH